MEKADINNIQSIVPNIIAAVYGDNFDKETIKGIIQNNLRGQSPKDQFQILMKSRNNRDRNEDDIRELTNYYQ